MIKPKYLMTQIPCWPD